MQNTSKIQNIKNIKYKFDLKGSKVSRSVQMDSISIKELLSDGSIVTSLSSKNSNGKEKESA